MELKQTIPRLYTVPAYAEMTHRRWAKFRSERSHTNERVAAAKGHAACSIRQALYRIALRFWLWNATGPGNLWRIILTGYDANQSCMPQEW